MDKNEIKKSFGEWLTRKYLEWQLSHGRGSVTEFAAYLGFPQQNVSRWMLGKSLPGAQYYHKLAKLGDDFYSVLRVEPPEDDPETRRFRTFLREVGEEYTTDLLKTLSDMTPAQRVDLLRRARERSKGSPKG